jgi:ribosomal protein S18 acetylase RimI-like enzyme
MSIQIQHVDTNQVAQYSNYFVDIVYNNFIELTSQPNVKHSQEEIYKLLTSDSFSGFIVYYFPKNSTKSKIIGYLFGEFMTTPDGRYVYYLSYIFIAPSFRRHHLGNKLMEKMIESCKSIGVNFIVLMCDLSDKKLVRFYENFGFVPDPALHQGQQHDVLCLYL